MKLKTILPYLRQPKFLIPALLVAVFIGYKVFQSVAGQFFKPPVFPTIVETQKVKARDWQPEINSIGTLRAMQGIVVKAETSGRITKLLLESGKYVEKDTPLVEIYPDSLQAELAANMAELALSRTEYQRQQKLFQKKVASQSELDKAKARLQADQAAVDKTKAELQKTSIRAPFTGRLGLKSVELGDFVAPGDPIVTLQQTDPMRADFSIPEVYLTQLAVGQTVLVHARSYPGETFTGTVYAYDAVINPETRMLAVRAQVPNPNHKLMPGIFVETALRVGTPQPTFVVPEMAVVYDDEGNYVYRVIDQHAVKTTVTLGPVRDGEIAIVSGLKANDVVVTAGQLKLRDGALVMDRNQVPPQTQNKS